MYPGRKCGIVIAGNAGRPAGALGRFPDVAAGWDGPSVGLVVTERKTFRTQEEDVVASWIRGELQTGRTERAQVCARGWRVRVRGWRGAPCTLRINTLSAGRRALAHPPLYLLFFFSLATCAVRVAC